MRRTSAVALLCAFLVTATAPLASAKTTQKTTASKLAFALWTTRQDLAPNVHRITNWYVEMSAGTDGTHSQLFYERFLCQDAVVDVPCVVEENRDGSSRAKGRRFSVSPDLRKGSLDAMFDVQSIRPPGVPVGTPSAVHVAVSWTAIDVPVRAQGVTAYDGRCAYRQTVRETAVRAAATGTLDGEPLGKTTEARLVSSVVQERRESC